MDPNLFKHCDLEQIEKRSSEEDFEYITCQKKYRLRPEDEISLDSIFSALLSMVEPTEVAFADYKWEVCAKDMVNAKQAIIFEENLYISQLKNTNCKLNETNKIFLENELQEVGKYTLNIEESYDGYVVFSRSQMVKGADKNVCGHCLKGKYDDKFLLICEKRNEFDYVDKARIEKNLEARYKEDVVVAVRETKINEESQKFKAVINVKGRDDVFLLDGGVVLLMRCLVINNFRGEFEYYSLNLFGKIMRCVLSISNERKKVRVFYRNFDNVICVKNSQFFNDERQDVSETYYTANGKIVLHYWLGYNYLVHATRVPPKPQERILPKLELMWRADNTLFKKYKLRKKLTYDNALTYLIDHPELCDFMHDYILALLKFKPEGVLEFTVKFFQNMKNTF